MFLTVFYIAATWLQSRRLGFITRKLAQFLSEKKSYVLCRISSNIDFDKSDLISEYCCNKKNINVSEVLWDSSCVSAWMLSDKETINLDRWISIPDGATKFPLPLSNASIALSEPRLFLLLEATCTHPVVALSNQYDVSKIGQPLAWKANSKLVLLLESDLNHLADISLRLMENAINIDEGLSISSIHTVEASGRPCLVVNSNQTSAPATPSRSISLDSPDINNSEWPERHLARMSSVEWLDHMEMLRQFSRCADEVTLDSGPVVVSSHRSSCLILGNKVISLPLPVTVEIFENTEEEQYTSNNEYENSDELAKSIPVTPEIKDILRNVSQKSGVITAIEGSRSPSGISTPARLEGITPHSPGGSIVSTPARVLPALRKNTFASLSSLGSVPSGSTLSLRSSGGGASARIKPPNVLVYSESRTTTDNIKAVLSDILHAHKYTIYSVSPEQLAVSTWALNCSLLVVCGSVPDNVEPLLINFLLDGGRLFCLCSSFLHTLLPTFRTAEVRERELVRFSYAKWNRVRLMHHVFCYQNSPVRTKFSREADEPPSEKDRVSPVPVMPATVQVLDADGGTHTLHVQVLGKEETWQTPSLMLAYFPSPGGRVVFSQVHLELDPSEISEEREGEALRSSDAARREIIKDIMATHLGLQCGEGKAQANDKYTPAYFLGRHEIKLAFLEKIRGNDRLGSLQVKFCGKGETPPAATASFLPVLIHACPNDFSTLEYFDTLSTESLGRLLLYCEVMTSSMDLLSGEAAHGLTIVPSRQTAGRGRTGNQWLSPPGCAMFSQQLIFPLDSYMGRRPSILQLVVSVALVSALSEITPNYAQALDLRLKWPNDIYTGDMIKIGGVLAACSFTESSLVCNIGCGINLDNDSPTTCLNSQISEYNKSSQQKLPKLSREKLLALTFSKLENIINRIQEGNISYLHDLYYTYWLHEDACVRVLSPAGEVIPVMICGIDEWGYLSVREQTGNVFTVQPDGNSFDMMEGLIIPK